MRISSIKQNSAELRTDEVTEVTSLFAEKLSIKFCDNKDGTFTALVPVKLPNSGENGDTRVFVTLLPLTVAGEATSNNKGARRVMVKVTMPYQAIDPDSTANGTDASRIDTARSGGAISAHMVISVPRATETDLKGIHGTTMQRAAQAQVQAVIGLLSVLVGPTGIGANVPNDTNHGGVALFQRGVDIRELSDGVVNLGETDGGATSPTYVLSNFQYKPSTPGKDYAYGAVRPVVLSDNLTGYLGTVGLDLSGRDSSQDFSNPGDPLARGLLGLSPFCGSAEAVVPSFYQPTV